jgi:hypothetical protein
VREGGELGIHWGRKQTGEAADLTPAALPAESTARQTRSGTVVFMVIRVAEITPTICATWVPEVSYASRMNVPL